MKGCKSQFPPKTHHVSHVADKPTQVGWLRGEHTVLPHLPFHYCEINPYVNHWILVQNASFHGAVSMSLKTTRFGWSLLIPYENRCFHRIPKHAVPLTTTQWCHIPAIRCQGDADVAAIQSTARLQYVPVLVDFFAEAATGILFVFWAKSNQFPLAGEWYTHWITLVYVEILQHTLHTTVSTICIIVCWYTVWIFQWLVDLMIDPQLYFRIRCWIFKSNTTNENLTWSKHAEGSVSPGGSFWQRTKASFFPNNKFLKLLTGTGWLSTFIHSVQQICSSAINGNPEEDALPSWKLTYPVKIEGWKMLHFRGGIVEKNISG